MRYLHGILLETLAVLFIPLFLLPADCASFPAPESQKCPLGMAGNAVPEAQSRSEGCLFVWDLKSLSWPVVLFGIEVCTAEISPCLVFSS